MQNLLIIPARSGSKRVKDKNIKIFNGKPIIEYSIKNALSSKLFDKIHVSTESKRVANIVRKSGINFDFMRPKELADDKTGIFKVIKFVAGEYLKQGIRFENIWILSACAPLINHKILIQAYKLYLSNMRKKALLAVNEYSAPIEWANKINKKNILVPLSRELSYKNSQNLSPKYHDSGAFSIFPAKQIYESKHNNYKKTFIGFKLTKFQGVDIDDLEDWVIAEAIHKNLK